MPISKEDLWVCVLGEQRQSKPCQLALFNQEAVAGFGLFGLDQFVAVLIAEMRHVDHRQRIAGVDANERAACHGGKLLACLDHGEGAFQAAKIVENGVQAVQFRAQNFQNGFFAATSAVSCGSGAV